MLSPCCPRVHFFFVLDNIFQHRYISPDVAFTEKQMTILEIMAIVRLLIEVLKAFGILSDDEKASVRAALDNLKE